MLRRLTLFIASRRYAVLAAWAAALVIACFACTRLPALLTNHFSLPGTDSERAETILETRFNQRTVGSFSLVVTSDGDVDARMPEIEAAAQRAVDELPTGRLVGVSVLSDKVVHAGMVSSLTSAEAKGHTEAMRKAIGQIDGTRTYLTGFAAIEHDLAPTLKADLWRGEVLIALPIAICLLMWAFGTLAFLLPLLLALVTVPVTLGLVFICAHAMELTSYVTNLVSLIGLGIAVDYSLLVVHRYREALRSGATPEVAIVQTMETAGRAVVVSGSAVAIGLALLVLLPLPFLRGFGIAGLLIPLVSVLSALTLLPALLLSIGARLDAIRLLPQRWLDARTLTEHGRWARLAHWIMRWPVSVMASATAVLLLMALPLLDLELGPGSNQDLPSALESVQGLAILTETVGAGATTPSSIVIDTGHAGGESDPAIAKAVERLNSRLREDPQVGAVYHVPGHPQFVDLSGRYLIVRVVGREDFGAASSLAFVARLRARHIPAAAFPASASVVVGGAPAAGSDFLSLVRQGFPWVMASILAVTFALLARAFRSLLLPLKAIALNLLSIGAAYGLTIVAFSWGWGVPFGLVGHRQIDAWIPVLVFAMLFGLSMDYEVFLVCRMREAWDKGLSNEDAVVSGLASTGRLVTSAGLIMCGAFAGFVAGSFVDLQQFGFTMTAAVLIDITVVRALLLPAAMKLFGRWNWYLPQSLAKLLRVSPSPLRRNV